MPRAIRTDFGRVHVTVTGKLPTNDPYVWIGNDEMGCVDTVGQREMKRLADQIYSSLGIPPRTAAPR